jgi:hypothetical protein
MHSFFFIFILHCTDESVRSPAIRLVTNRLYIPSLSDLNSDNNNGNIGVVKKRISLGEVSAAIENFALALLNSLVDPLNCSVPSPDQTWSRTSSSSLISSSADDATETFSADQSSRDTINDGKRFFAIYHS